MKSIYLLVLIFSLILGGCSDFSSDTTEFELSGKMYACDGNTQGDIIDDKKAGQKLYCNGYNWINLIPEDSIAQSPSDSENMYECKNGAIVKFESLCSEQINDHLPLDDSEYPFAGIPRIVIETENHREIKDRETEIPAKLQIWGQSAPQTKIFKLTIKGRGSSSWIRMPKKSYRLKLESKQPLLGLPSNKDWILAANFADKTLLKNYITYNLSSQLHAYYTPKCKFAEIFINGNYNGLYLFVESVKVSSKRVNIPKEENSFLMEVDSHFDENDIVVYSNDSIPFTIHYPTNPTKNDISNVKSHLDSLEDFLKEGHFSEEELSKWINLDDYILYYWVQEFSENTDARFNASVYFSWTKENGIKMGPLWDFDIAYGGYPYKPSILQPNTWFVKNFYWNLYLFKKDFFQAKVKDYWVKNRHYFESLNDSLDSYSKFISKAAKNNFKRWDVLNCTDIYHFHIYANQSHKEAVDTLKSWISGRIQWIDSHL